MNIYALEGFKVRCATLEAGSEYQRKHHSKLLEVGKEYTVERTEVHSLMTDVFLKEFPGEVFNSVFFEDVVEQSKEDSRLHPDWRKYHLNK